MCGLTEAADSQRRRCRSVGVQQAALSANSSSQVRLQNCSQVKYHNICP